MADVEFKAIGLEELIQTTAALHGQLGPMVRDFLSRSVLNIEGAAKDLCPVDTGRLRASIAHKVSSAPIPDWGSVGTNVLYARHVEFGTKKMKAQPYLRPGLQRVQPDIEGNLERIKSDIEALWK